MTVIKFLNTRYDKISKVLILVIKHLKYKKIFAKKIINQLMSTMDKILIVISVYGRFLTVLYW